MIRSPKWPSVVLVAALTITLGASSANASNGAAPSDAATPETATPVTAAPATHVATGVPAPNPAWALVPALAFLGWSLGNRLGTAPRHAGSLATA